MKLYNRSLYLQVRDAIIEMIDKDAEFMSRLPSEQEFAEMLGVSRNTVREALKTLENEGYIMTRHGVGTFLIQNHSGIKTNLSVLESSTDIILRHGFKPGTKSIHYDRRKSPKHVSQNLKLPPHVDVLYIERVRTADDEPIALVEDYIPFEDNMFDRYSSNANESLFQFLKEVGHEIKFSACKIIAVLSDKRMEEKLSLSSPTALLCLKQTHFSIKGEAILYSDSYFLSNKLEFNIIRKSVN